MAPKSKAASKGTNSPLKRGSATKKAAAGKTATGATRKKSSAVKTSRTGASVRAFVDGIEDEGRRRDVRAVMKMMRRVTGCRPKMWGHSIIGYGSYTYRYASGRSGDWPVAALSPRKQNLTVYIMAGFTPFTRLMKNLGKHKTGKSCLYLNRLEDVDLEVLEALIAGSVERMRGAK